MSFLLFCATKILVPEFLSIDKVVAQRARPEKILQYPGVTEGVYLWALEEQAESEAEDPGQAKPRTIFVRPEPRTAEYYAGGTDFMDELLLELQGDFELILLPRDNWQLAHYQESAFSGVQVAEKPLGLADIIRRCSLFIGAGGTMTREAAVLGVPTISIYQDNLLDVDRYLVSQGLMAHNPALTSQYVRDFLAAAKNKDRPTKNY